ncbi:MAG: hypothetical protein RLZZ292_1381 [Bacteroidota bacterium]|jgi:hypothetical protein
MNILYYNDLAYRSVEKPFQKIVEFLKKGDFKSAEIKKMSNTPYYRAKIDAKNRLLFKFAKYQNETYILLLEVILNHDYEKSRFLNGAAVDETKLPDVTKVPDLKDDDYQPLIYVNPKAKHFHLLDKIISFDEVQAEVYSLPTPIIVIGSAGSGKTALTLEKLKLLNGEVLYITLSPYLVENSRNLYYAMGYENEKQEIDFLSFKEYLETIEIPSGREITYREFDWWYAKHRQTARIKDSHKVFEEFKGVLTGSIIDAPYLSREEYLKLGVRQSVFTGEERGLLYEVFVKYLDYLKENKHYDSNLVAYDYQAKTEKKYDFVVVDEVQDFTNVQLSVVLKSLKNPANFLLCGDSNQIVHPNFFSWSNVKTMFYKQDLKGNLIRILSNNYRNTPEVTEIANKLLLLKNTRFGSIDRESTYLVESSATQNGEVVYLEDTAKIKTDLNNKTKRSAKFAVLVMRQEEKANARRFFQTPLIFSVQEAKGLEYENIILYNFISDNEKVFREISDGITEEDLTKDMVYGRGKDKSDKSLEVYKFYVNSLYVAMTRAVKNLYFVEESKKHPLLNLLGLVKYQAQLTMKDQSSSMEDWQREARKLELQGKKEQADDIRKNILHTQTVPWIPITPEVYEELRIEALNPAFFNKKSKDRLFEYALIYQDTSIQKPLIALKYKRAENIVAESKNLHAKLYTPYRLDKFKDLQPQVTKYGVDFRNEFNQTPLLIAAENAAPTILKELLTLGADVNMVDNYYRNALQLCLQQAFLSDVYAKTKIGITYPILVTDSVKIKVNNRLIKVGNHSMEYFLLNFMLATLRHKILNTVVPAYDVDAIMMVAQHFPATVLSDRRKVRQYVSSILAKNEIDRKDPYNRMLFIRVQRGLYLINPKMEIAVGETWMNAYDMMRISALAQAEDKSSNQKFIIKFLEEAKNRKAVEVIEE